MNIFTPITAIVQTYRIVAWVRRQKKLIETDADKYFSDDNADKVRLMLEKYAKALEKGNGNLKVLPGWLRWLFSKTTVDNRFGRFAQRVLKSSKLERDDPKLAESIVYPCH